MSKVRFGLKNVHYAVLTETESGGVISYSWATPVAVPGAVSLTLDGSGDVNNFYADNMVYFASKGATSFGGDLEVAKVPDAMLTDIFGYTLDSTAKVLIKNAQKTPVRFALLYQIDGDADEQLYVLYNVLGTRPGIGSTTNTDTKTPQTQTSNISADPLANGDVFARTTNTTPSATKSGWFTSVFQEAGAVTT